MNSHTDSKLKSEIDFSKGLIDSLSSRTPGAIDEALAPKLSTEEKSEMVGMSEALAEITGDDKFRIVEENDEEPRDPTQLKPSKPTKPTKGQDESIKNHGKILSECIDILESKKNVPSNLVKKVILANKRINQYEKFLLRFIKKYS